MLFFKAASNKATMLAALVNGTDTASALVIDWTTVVIIDRQARRSNRIYGI